MYNVVSIRNIISIDSISSYGVCVFDVCFCNDWFVYVSVKLVGSCWVSCFILVIVWLLEVLGVVLLDILSVGNF